MRLLVPLLVFAISGSCLAQTQRLTDLPPRSLVQAEPGAVAGVVAAQTPFSGPAPMSSDFFRSPGTEVGTYDNLGIRQTKPGAADEALHCRQQAAPAGSCGAGPANGSH